MSNIKIFICAHKEVSLPQHLYFLPVQAGAALHEKIPGYQSDSEGDNISAQNPHFCELTCHYWAWKNLKAEYIGLAHYRRHFSKHPHMKDKWNAILKESDINNELGRIKVFVPGKRRYYIETLYSHYAHTHHIQQLDETRKILEEKYPQYVESFDKAVEKRWGYMFNMVIMKKDLLDAYCTWLFDILFELRNRLGEEGLTPFHSRYYGRVSEIIFNVWLDQQIKEGVINKSEIEEIPLIHMEKINWWKKGTAFLKAKFSGKKYSGSF